MVQFYLFDVLLFICCIVLTIVHVDDVDSALK